MTAGWAGRHLCLSADRWHPVFSGREAQHVQQLTAVLDALCAAGHGELCTSHLLA
jgi:hypothetical protein